MKNLSILVFILFLGFNSFAQDFSAAGSLGWANPNGSGISDEAGDLNLDGGLTYSLDALYKLNPKLGVGLQYTASLLAGAGEDDIDIFGMRVIGAKAHYQLKESGFRPYGSLTLGLAQLTTPEYTITSGTQTTTVEEQTGSGFGIMPELGLMFGRVFLGVQYIVPVKYTIEEANITDKAAGSMNFVLGYRQNFSF